MTKSQPLPPAARAARKRDKKRRAGLKRVERWVRPQDVAAVDALLAQLQRDRA